MRKRRLVLFVNMYFDPSIAATAQHLSDLVRHLAACRWAVEVLCSNKLYENTSIRLPSFERAAGIRVRRLPLRFFARSGAFRALAYLEFLCRVLLHVLLCRRPDVCVTMTTPPFLVLAGAVLRVRGCRHMHWSLDLYPEAARALGTLGRLGAFLFARLRNLAWRLCDRIVALGPLMAENISKTGFPERKVRIVSAWARADDVRSEPPPDGRFVLLYSGNMGRAHEFRTVLRAVRELPGVEFAFVGGGPRRGEIERAANELPNVSLRPPVPRKQIGRLFASASAQLVTLDPRADGLLVPSKMFGAMASGRPLVLVASARNELAQELEGGGFGFRVEPGDAEGLVSAIRKLAGDRKLAREMGRKARAAFLRRYELSVCTEAFADVLAELARGP